MNRRGPLPVASILLQAAVVLFACISCSAAQHGWKPSDLPNPQRDIGKVCGRNGIKSAVCTPDGFLSGRDADALDGLINFVAEGTNGFEPARCGSHVEGRQVAVAIIDKMDPSYDIFDSKLEKSKRFAKELHDSWGVGDVEYQNGVLLFVAVKDRVMYISTGRGAKQLLTDSRIQSILEKMRPQMREELYGRALLGAVERIGYVLSKKSPEDLDEKLRGVNVMLIILCFSIFVALFQFLGGITSERRKREKYRRCRAALRRIDDDSERARENNYQSSSCPICLEEFESATRTVEPDAEKPLSSDSDAIIHSSADENDTEQASLLHRREQPSPAENASSHGSSRLVLPCGHNFHADCVEQWCTSGNGTNRANCPVCRRPIDGEQEQLRTDSETFEYERRFRIRRIHVIYPDYISYSSMVRMERERNCRLETHIECPRREPQLMELARNAGERGSSFTFGGGSSRGGGGGGSSW